MTPPYPNDDDPMLLGELSAVPLKPETEPEGWFKRWCKDFVRFWREVFGKLPEELVKRAAIAKVESLETENAVKLMGAIGNVQVAQSAAAKSNAEAFATMTAAQLDLLERMTKLHAAAPDELKGMLKEKMSELRLHGGDVFVAEKREVALEPAQEALPEMAEES